jgi:hypothetical protein
MTEYRRMRREFVGADGKPLAASKEELRAENWFSGEAYDGNTTQD